MGLLDPILSGLRQVEYGGEVLKSRPKIRLTGTGVSASDNADDEVTEIVFEAGSAASALSSELASQGGAAGRVLLVSGRSARGDKGAMVFCLDALAEGESVDDDPVYQSSSEGLYWRWLPIGPLTPYVFGAVGGGVVNDWVPLRKFFAYCGRVNVGVAVIDGVFLCDGWITVSGDATKTYYCNAVIRPHFTGANIDGDCITITAAGIAWIGRIEGFGNSLVWADRTCRDFIRVLGAHNTFQSIQVTNVRRWGFNPETPSTGTHVHKIRGIRCGTGDDLSTNYQKFINVESFTNFLGSTTPERYAVLTVSEIPSHIEAGKSFLLLPDADETVLLIEATNTDPETGVKTLTCFPHVPAGFTAPDDVEVIAGGVYNVEGSDSSNHTIGILSALSCGIAHRAAALYPPQITTASTQACGIGIVVGGGRANASVGGGITNLYTESHRIDVLKATRAEVSYKIANTLGIHIAEKMRSLDPLWPKFIGLDVAMGSSWVRRALTGEEGTLTLAPTPIAIEGYNRDEKTIFLDSTGGHLGRVAGLDELWIVAHGTATSEQPLGTWTIEPTVDDYADGYRVNGGASVTYSAWPAGTNAIRAKLVTKNWQITRMTMLEMFAGSAAYSAASLADGTSVTRTIPVTGAALGDLARVSADSDTQGIELYAWVSATDTVSVRISNRTGGAVDLPLNMRALVEKMT